MSGRPVLRVAVSDQQVNSGRRADATSSLLSFFDLILDKVVHHACRAFCLFIGWRHCQCGALIDNSPQSELCLCGLGLQFQTPLSAPL
jgi:hypothetical protein